MFYFLKKCHKRKLQHYFVRISSRELGTIIPWSSDTNLPTKQIKKSTDLKTHGFAHEPSLERLSFGFFRYHFPPFVLFSLIFFYFTHSFLSWPEGVKMHTKYYDLGLSHFEGNSLYIP